MLWIYLIWFIWEVILGHVGHILFVMIPWGYLFVECYVDLQKRKERK